MQSPIEQFMPDDEEWQHLCNKLRIADSFSAIVLAARLIGLRFAKVLIEQQLAERVQARTTWHHCSICNTQLVSKGFTH